MNQPQKSLRSGSKGNDEQGSGSPVGGGGIETQSPKRKDGEVSGRGQRRWPRLGEPQTWQGRAVPESGPHHLVGRRVLVGLVQVTLASLRLHRPPAFRPECDVGHVVRGEHQQVQRVASASRSSPEGQKLTGLKASWLPWGIRAGHWPSRNVVVRITGDPLRAGWDPLQTQNHREPAGGSQGQKSESPSWGPPVPGTPCCRPPCPRPLSAR